MSRLRRRFLDSLKIHVIGGRGGNGLPQYGGVGGKGGDVYIEAHPRYPLKKLLSEFPDTKFTAGPGEGSRKVRILGNIGDDIVVKCPTGVSVVAANKRVLGELNNDGDRVLVSSGGCGGGPQNNFLGQKGQNHIVTLDLKLLADIGFVGFPNAGKSTLLKALSRAQPKIASYPFTTIHPSIGILEYEDFRTISAADLPGLIEGSHMNFGMGHNFLKHCMRTKMLLFVVDIDGFYLSPKHPKRTALETVLFLNKELELYDETLTSKPAVLAINKIDLDPNFEKVNRLKEDLSEIAVNDETLPKELRSNHYVKFDAIIPIAAKMRLNVKELKQKVRTIIDIHHEKTMKDDMDEPKTTSENKMSSVIYT